MIFYFRFFLITFTVSVYFILTAGSSMKHQRSGLVANRIIEKDKESRGDIIKSHDNHGHLSWLSGMTDKSKSMNSYSSGELNLQKVKDNDQDERIHDVTTTHEEVRHIGFLKVHKAASSTMQNIFFRFGLKRNLTFVFTEHPNYFSREYGKPIPLVKPTKRSGFDILCNHGVFNYDLYSSLLPNDTVYIGIVRDPLAVFISAVNFYTQKSQMISYLGKVPGNKLQNLIRKPEIYDKGLFSYSKNVMARDFGFAANRKSVREKLMELDGQFRLVILVEYFEESLILMKRFLNWRLQDILFISNNVYGKGRSIADLTPKDIELFKKRNALDYAVYNFFYGRFWKLFEMEGDDIHSEVLNYKNALQLVYTFCKQPEVKESLTISRTEWNQEIVVSKDDCKFMTMDELTFIRHLRALQGSELGRRKPVLLHKSQMQRTG